MNITAFICNCLMRTVCFAGATLLAYYGKDGWGWLIFAGILVGVYTEKTVTKDNAQQEARE